MPPELGGVLIMAKPRRGHGGLAPSRRNGLARGDRLAVSPESAPGLSFAARRPAR